ncbi:MAG TPA: cyclopropane-fatty-acyl-phospholipid synthase family protein [Acidimicrobiia bacterium]|nr:cyclopropane-fatty-acyl-phospholipid synthase family protein [Acidimicrobiia bacterium]
MAATMTIADLLEQVVGPDLPIAIEAYDGSRMGPANAPATLSIRSKTALRRIVQAPGELGFGRAYVAGDLDLEGDIFAALELRDRLPHLKLRPAHFLAALRIVGAGALKPVPAPPEEVRLHGRRHTKQRDAAAISHHYDVSNDFYRRVLGPSMTYSCAVWTDPGITLEEAQANKHELICRKLGLEPGMRLLDIGCGWGGMLLHAAEHHGVQAVGVTLSKRQAELAEKRAAEAGLAGKVEVRYQDYRDVDDGPYDAISSIGMFEHVGLRQLAVYFERCYELLPRGGRLLNHAISRPPGVTGSTADGRTRFARRSFIDRYVFPDGELHEIGSVVSAIQRAGFEARHMETLREHYALTLRAWVGNLEASWDECVADAGVARARIWRLYMAASVLQFEANRTQVHQVLATKTDGGRSGLPLRPRFE